MLNAISAALFSRPISRAQSATSGGASGAPRPTDGPDVAAEKPFSEVVLDARKALDEGYKTLGHRADDSTSWAEWSAMGFEKLDRRTLYAIASNQGGLFSETERSVANSQMSKQVGDAMLAADPSHEDPLSAFKAAIDFLDEASPEEKASFDWAQNRATAQSAYLQIARNQQVQPENVDTGNPIVNLLDKAYDEIKSPSDKLWDMPSWRRARELWDLQKEDEPPLHWTL